MDQELKDKFPLESEVWVDQLEDAESVKDLYKCVVVGYRHGRLLVASNDYIFATDIDAVVSDEEYNKRKQQEDDATSELEKEFAVVNVAVRQKVSEAVSLVKEARELLTENNPLSKNAFDDLYEELYSATNWYGSSVC